MSRNWRTKYVVNRREITPDEFEEKFIKTLVEPRRIRQCMMILNYQLSCITLAEDFYREFLVHKEAHNKQYLWIEACKLKVYLRLKGQTFEVYSASRI